MVTITEWGVRLTLRVQVPNNHVLTQNLYYNYYYPKPKYPSIWYMDPRVLNPKPYISLNPKPYISLYIYIYIHLRAMHTSCTVLGLVRLPFGAPSFMEVIRSYGWLSKLWSLFGYPKY